MKCTLTHSSTAFPSLTRTRIYKEMEHIHWYHASICAMKNILVPSYTTVSFLTCTHTHANIAHAFLSFLGAARCLTCNLNMFYCHFVGNLAIRIRHLSVYIHTRTRSCCTYMYPCLYRKRFETWAHIYAKSKFFPVYDARVLEHVTPVVTTRWHNQGVFTHIFAYSCSGSMKTCMCVTLTDTITHFARSLRTAAVNLFSALANRTPFHAIHVNIYLCHSIENLFCLDWCIQDLSVLFHPTKSSKLRI